LGIYVYLYELQDTNRAQEAPKKEKIIGFNPDDVQEIEIVLTKKGQTLLFKKADGQWRIEKPLRTDAIPESIDNIFSIFDLGFIEVIDESPSDITQYGLDNPEVELTITVNEGGNFRTHTLLFGSNNLTNSACYCKVRGQPKILLVGILYKKDLEKDVSFYTRKSLSPQPAGERERT